MRAAPKPGIVAAGVLLASAGPWTGLQAALAAAHGRESAAVELRAIARVGRAALPATDNGVSFWGPLVASGTIQLLALSLLALAFVMVPIEWRPAAPIMFGVAWAVVLAVMGLRLRAVAKRVPAEEPVA